ncbi:MAG: ABC transporter permease [Bacteroides sp.]|nr:ABC transporter permease [Bacteroides sp.]
MNRFVYNASRREWRRFTSRRLYWSVTLALPLFCLLFMATIFGSGQMEQLPIAVVDLDHTLSSRKVVRLVESVPALRIAARPVNEAEARQAMQEMSVYGYLVIPHGFERSMQRGDATLAYYLHYALLSVGGELTAAFEEALGGVSLSPIMLTGEQLGATAESMERFLLPVVGDVHPLHNPDLNYATYLTQPFYFILLQILVLLQTVYCLGSEVKEGTLRAWLQAAGLPASLPASPLDKGTQGRDVPTSGMVAAAVWGKLLPYTLLFSLTAVTANLFFCGVMQIGVSGSLWLLNGVSILFVMATQALGVTLFALLPRMAYTLSFASMIGSLGATLSGVTFPLSAMYLPVRWAAALFPVRHFTEALKGVVYRGCGAGELWSSITFLLLFMLMATALLPLLRWWLRHRLLPEEEEREHRPASVAVCQTDSPTLLQVIRQEWQRISRTPAVLMVLCGGIFLYGLLYNYMYAPDVVRHSPIVVVDASRSALSREYIRLMESTPQVRVVAHTPDMAEAREWMKRGEADAILYLPADFEGRVYRGETGRFLLYASTSCFLPLKGIQEAATRTMLALDERCRTVGLPFLSPGGIVAAGTTAPVSIVGQALYNPSAGYGSYLIPAVLVVIIFQTILMLTSMLRGGENELRPEGGIRPYATAAPCLWGWREAVRLVAGRTLVCLMLYTLFALFLMGLLPLLFHIPHQGNLSSLALFLLPFLLSTSLFAQTFARCYSDAEAPLLLIAFFSVGYIFLSGVSYPLELMPRFWQGVRLLLPAPPAIQAFVKLDSMGSSLSDAAPELTILWAQVLLYATLAVWQARRSV